MLAEDVTESLGGRNIRLLPSINPKDGLFLFQPAERRFGFVGRVDLVRTVASSGTLL